MNAGAIVQLKISSAPSAKATVEFALYGQRRLRHFPRVEEPVDGGLDFGFSGGMAAPNPPIIASPGAQASGHLADRAAFGVCKKFRFAASYNSAPSPG